MAGFRFEDYRQPWETGPHWELKREFMEKYVDMFPEDRLLCLAQAYSNVILMNCTYPTPVMEQISHLAKPLKMRKKFQGDEINPDNEEPEQKYTEKAKLLYAKAGKKFKQVKFCSSKEENVKESLNDERPSKKLKLECDEKLNNIKQLNQETAEIEREKGNSVVDMLGILFIQEFVQKVRTFQVQRANDFEALTKAAQSLKVEKDLITEITPVPNRPAHDPLFCCKILLKNCLISTASEKKKKTAKWESARTAVDNLTNMATGSGISVPLEISNETNITLPDANSDFCFSNVSKKSDASLYLPIPKEDFKILSMLFKHLDKEVKNQCAYFANVVRQLGLEKFFDFKRNLIPIRSVPNTKGIHEFSVIYKNTEISMEKGPVLKWVRNRACEKAIDILEKLEYCMISDGKLVVTERITNVHEVPEAKIINAPNNFNRVLFESSVRDRFALLDNLNNHMRSYKSALPDSAGFCHKKFNIEVGVNPGTVETMATILLDGEIVGTAMGSSKEDAKYKAIFNALEFLRKKYYTIQIKSEFEDCFKVSREYAYSLQGKSDALTDSNIGCKMLKNMGWSGGGLGTSGIAEPVGLDTQHNFKKGLGFEKPSENLKEFKQRITPLLLDIKKSKSLGHLVFSKDFTKEERKTIHGIAARLGLISQSRGKDSNRFLVIRRKYDVNEILQHLYKVGGSDNKFQLIDASVDELNPFKMDVEV